MQINTESPATGRKITVEYDFGATVQDAIDKFGAEAVHSAFVDAAVVKLQAMIRGNLSNVKTPKTDEQILEKVAQWKPGFAMRKPGKSMVDQVADRYKALTSDEARQNFLAELKAKLAAVQGA